MTLASPSAVLTALWGTVVVLAWRQALALSIVSDTLTSLVTIAQVAIVLGYRRSLTAWLAGMSERRDRRHPSLLLQE